MTKKQPRERTDYELAKMSAKLKAITALVKEWKKMLPSHFYLIITSILEEN